MLIHTSPGPAFPICYSLAAQGTEKTKQGAHEDMQGRGQVLAEAM